MGKSRQITMLVLSAGACLLACCALAGGAGAKTVWLCRPGQPRNPCTPGLSTTVYSPKLTALRVTHPHAVKHPAIDCFYVYPTVSDQKTEHANLHVDPEERSIALYQAARYSQVCRVFAPMYRQVTVPYLEKSGGESLKSLALPLRDVRAAFKDFLARYSHGRGFVLIGHSQGSFLLRELIAKDIDPKSALRKRLVSAIVLGGNVLVKRGSSVGGDFKHVPGCTKPGQLGCVIAFSTFDQPPPTNSLFGRAPNSRDAVLCTDPAKLSHASGLVDLISPSAPFAPGTMIAAGISLLGVTQPHPHTVWVSEPGAYAAHCSSSHGIDVLQIKPRNGAQTAKPSPTPQWGLHLLDANIALGNLVSIVGRQAARYARGH